MSDPITVRLSNTVKAHLEHKSEISGTSMSEEARKALESTVTPEALSDSFLIGQYSIRAEKWLEGRPQQDTQAAIGAISALRKSNIDPVLKKAIVKRLSHYLFVAADRVASQMQDGETPSWKYGGGAYHDEMMALRASYVALHGEPNEEYPAQFEEFVDALIDNDLNHALRGESS